MREYSPPWMQTGEDTTRYPHTAFLGILSKAGHREDRKWDSPGISLVTGKQVGTHQTFSWRLSLVVRSSHGGHRPLGGGDM